MRSKEAFIEDTGGFRLGESPGQFQQRVNNIQALRKKMRNGKITESERQRLYGLLGLPPDEFDYDGTDVD
jgi:hypothetical protein